MNTQDRALLLLAQMNKNKPHGKSSKMYNKGKGDVLPQLRGNADLKVEFGNNQQYPLMPSENLPFVGKVQTAAVGLMQEDPSTVLATQYLDPSQSSSKMVKRKLKKKGKSGFLLDPDPINPLDIYETTPLRKPKDESTIPVKREKLEAIIPKPKAGAESKNPKKKTRKTNEAAKKRRMAAIDNWHQFFNQIKTRPAMVKLKKGMPTAGSEIRELVLDHDKACSSVADQIEKCSAGSILEKIDSDVLKLGREITLEEMQEILDDIRKQIAQYYRKSGEPLGERFPLTSVKRERLRRQKRKRDEKMVAAKGLVY